MPGTTQASSDLITLFLCGDLMTGRGIDQILPHASDPTLHEPQVTSAEDYVKLAERASGPIPRAAGFSYVWGDALEELDARAPDARIVNLETAVTTSDDYSQRKKIHYRMHPANASCLTTARIEACVLANNHVLDRGYTGLEESLRTLERIGVSHAGAGRNLTDAQRPAELNLPGRGRILLFAFGSESSGIPFEWAARDDKPGLSLIDEYSPDAARRVQELVEPLKRPGDLVVVSIHWGPNWGYSIPLPARQFAHELIDRAGVDCIHGHSSHHVKGLEAYRDKPILYGCGDFLTDYEGIEGYEAFRDDLGLMYFLTMDPNRRRLVQLDMRPTRIRRFQVTRASTADASWLAGVLAREGRALGTRVEHKADDLLELHWD